MSNEVVIRSGKTLRVGEEAWTIVEPTHVPVACPDLFLDTRLLNNSVIMTLGQTRVEGGEREVAVCTRLRMDLAFAQLLRNNLDHLIQAATKPADKSKAN